MESNQSYVVLQTTDTSPVSTSEKDTWRNLPNRTCKQEGNDNKNDDYFIHERFVSDGLAENKAKGATNNASAKINKRKDMEPKARIELASLSYQERIIAIIRRGRY